MQAERKEWQLSPDSPLQFLKGVGEGRAALLASNDLHTVRDLLYLFPHRYEDRSRLLAIRELPTVTGPVTLRGRVLSAKVKVSPVKRLQIFEAVLDDGTGTVMLVWFNQGFLKDQIERGEELLVYGQARLTSYGRFQIENADWEKVDASGVSDDDSAIVPVYSSVSALQPKLVRRLVAQALPAVSQLDDPLEPHRRELRVIGVRDAIAQLHHPATLTDALYTQSTAAHRRLILDEFIAFQLALQMRRSTEEKVAKKRIVRVDDALRTKVRQILPFKLTGAQKRVLREIAAELQAPAPMYRLLQGDVGSGKTIVALIAALIVILNGHQAALLAPTEILAEQHFERIGQLLENAGVTVRRLTGSTPAAERRKLLSDLAEGRIDLLVGTHAIIEPKVIFHSLALAIVDEQHRFGVVQRQKLFDKGDSPDILVMTATPIPRSLAISLYGDLDLSVIDELPPGRRPVKTVVRGSAQLPKVCAFVEKELADGGQAYVVYPIIEESEKIDLKPLMVGVEEIRAELLGRRVGVLHGRMTAEEKESVMREFKEHRLDVLVSTTVIEVGIDVPNASIMVIQSADRFGLAQLHQLRGRVGRGARESYCVLLREEHASEEAKGRLREFAQTHDGFAVAEKDLELRGAGDFFGTRQSGVGKFRFGNILRDHKLMEESRDFALRILKVEGLEKATALLQRLAPRSSPFTKKKD